MYNPLNQLFNKKQKEQKETKPIEKKLILLTHLNFYNYEKKSIIPCNGSRSARLLQQ